MDSIKYEQNISNGMKAFVEALDLDKSFFFLI